MKVHFIKKEEIAENIFSFYFKPEKPVHYTAGQFTEIYLPHKNKDNRGERRWFTLSSAPHEEFLSITTNFSPEKGSSFKKTLKDLKPGTELHLASPMGDFVLPKDDSIPLIFAAGGIGCTPFHSIITDLKITGQKRNISMIYAAQKIKKVAFKDTFETLGDKFKIILRDTPKNWNGLSGQLTGEKLIELTKSTTKHYIYLSGPEPMIEALQKDLKNAGINKRRIQTDFFPGYEPI